MRRFPKVSSAHRGAFTCLFPVVFMIGCSLEDPAIAELKRLCEKDAGLEILDSVEVEGFYRPSGPIDLINSDYDFVEYCENHPASLSRFVEPGCYRMTKVKRDSGRCEPRLDKRLSGFVVDPYPEFLKDNCLSVEKIESPSAEYGVISNVDRWTGDDEVPIFYRSETKIVRMIDEEVLARYVNYSVTRSVAVPVSRSCVNYYENPPPFKTARVIETVLKPKLK